MTDICQLIKPFNKLSVESRHDDQDPDLEQIEAVCQSLVGASICFQYLLKVESGDEFVSNVNECNSFGSIFEKVLFPVIHTHVPTFSEGPLQSSPDFVNQDWLYELKCFKENPGFDIGNYCAIVDQLCKSSEKMDQLMYRTKSIPRINWSIYYVSGSQLSSYRTTVNH